MNELIKALDVPGQRGIREGEMVISSSLRNRRRRVPPKPPGTSLIVEDDLTPDISGDYVYVAQYNSKAYYKHRTLNWFIWYDPFDEPVWYIWNISSALGSTAGPHWDKKVGFSYAPEPGDYRPLGGAAGTATVELP